MERKFNLIKSDFEKHEKRVLPRFPFCYLTFKTAQQAHAFEIKDISYTGMQLYCRDQEMSYKEGGAIQGMIHWLGHNLSVQGSIKWINGQRLGVEFHKRHEQLTAISDFLKLDKMVKHLKPLHKMSSDLELPPRLKYWLRSDGPVEIFVWQHAGSEIAKFQILCFENFIEWEEGKGTNTGRIISKRNVDSPLINEDEWVFKLDLELDETKMNRGVELLNLLHEDLLPSEAHSFMMRQLS